MGRSRSHAAVPVSVRRPNLFCDWLIVVSIRSAGTAAGAFLAHHVPGPHGISG